MLLSASPDRFRANSLILNPRLLAVELTINIAERSETLVRSKVSARSADITSFLPHLKGFATAEAVSLIMK